MTDTPKVAVPDGAKPKRETPYSRLLAKFNNTQEALLNERNQHDETRSALNQSGAHERENLRRIAIQGAIIELQQKLTEQLDKPKPSFFRAAHLSRDLAEVERLRRNIFQAKNELARGGVDAPGYIQGLAQRSAENTQAGGTATGRWPSSTDAFKQSGALKDR